MHVANNAALVARVRTGISVLRDYLAPAEATVAPDTIDQVIFDYEGETLRIRSLGRDTGVFSTGIVWTSERDIPDADNGAANMTKWVLESKRGRSEGDLWARAGVVHLHNDKTLDEAIHRFGFAHTQPSLVDLGIVTRVEASKDVPDMLIKYVLDHFIALNGISTTVSRTGIVKAIELLSKKLGRVSIKYTEPQSITKTELMRRLKNDHWILDRHNQSYAQRAAHFYAVNVTQQRHTGTKKESFNVVWYTGKPEHRWSSRIVRTIDEAVALLATVKEEADMITAHELNETVQYIGKV